MNLARWQLDTDITAALSERKIAVVGLSANPARPSYDVAKVMQAHGYTIVPINPQEDHVLGATSYPSLSAAAADTGSIALVNVFRESSAVPAIAEDAVSIGARFLWLQFGVISLSGIKIAEAGGLACIVDRCLKIEHRRLYGLQHRTGA